MVTVRLKILGTKKWPDAFDLFDVTSSDAAKCGVNCTQRVFPLSKGLLEIPRVTVPF